MPSIHEEDGKTGPKISSNIVKIKKIYIYRTPEPEVGS
jgi:hypothetical protein